MCFGHICDPLERKWCIDDFFVLHFRMCFFANSDCWLLFVVKIKEGYLAKGIPCVGIPVFLWILQCEVSAFDNGIYCSQLCDCYMYAESK